MFVSALLVTAKNWMSTTQTAFPGGERVSREQHSQATECGSAI